MKVEAYDQQNIQKYLTGVFFKMIYDTESFSWMIGLALEEAEPRTEFILRVISQDGEEYFVTADYNSHRINVSIKNGKIDKIVSIG